MLALEITDGIRALLTREKRVDVATLSARFGVSSVTIRKYLCQLEEEGFLVKIHGGAMLAEGRDIPPPVVPAIANEAGKQRIADLAFQTIRRGESIFLGSGATCYLLAKRLREVEDIRIVTNNISALYELIPYNKNVFLLGGEIVYSGGMISASWDKAESYCAGLQVNKAFTSAAGVDLVGGLTVNHTVSAHMYRLIPRLTENWYLIADHEKFGKLGFYQVAPMENIKYVITDQIDDGTRERLSAMGIPVIVDSD